MTVQELLDWVEHHNVSMNAEVRIEYPCGGVFRKDTDALKLISPDFAIGEEAEGNESQLVISYGR